MLLAESGDRDRALNLLDELGMAAGTSPLIHPERSILYGSVGDTARNAR